MFWKDKFLVALFLRYYWSGSPEFITEADVFSCCGRMWEEAYLVRNNSRSLVGASLSSLSLAKAVSNYPPINLALTWQLIVKCFQFSEKLPSNVGYYHYHPIVCRVQCNSVCPMGFWFLLVNSFPLIFTEVTFGCLRHDKW